MKNFCQVLLAVLLTGCSWALKPGSSSVSPGQARFKQSENPKTESSQTYERTEEKVFALPEDTPVISKPIKTTVTEKVTTKIGAAQKDTAREFGAKLSSMKGIMWAGVLLFTFGIASAFWPPLKVIVGSVTTSAVACVAGVALIVLPSLIVGNEILILCIAGGAVVVHFLAHRHATIHTKLKDLEKEK